MPGYQVRESRCVANSTEVRAIGICCSSDVADQCLLLVKKAFTQTVQRSSDLQVEVSSQIEEGRE